MQINQKIIGIIPAAGYAHRLSDSSLSCSKEIYPIPHPDGVSKPVISCLFDRFKQASINNLFIIIREEKWDIPGQLPSTSEEHPHIAYLITKATPGVPHTLDIAYPFIEDHIVALGYPDIIFTPDDVFEHLLEKQSATDADLVLGLFHAVNPQKTDMVDFGDDGSLNNIIVKPRSTSLKYTWMMAVWTPVFTQFLHRSIIDNGKADTELHVGDIFRKAIRSGLKTSYVIFEEGRYLDIGTPDDLARIHDLQWFHQATG